MIALLPGCGGGGGGDAPAVSPPVAQTFTAWSAVRPNSRVTAQGMSITRNFTVDANGNVNAIFAASAPDTAASSAALTFGPNFSIGPNPEMTGLQFNAPAGSVSWDEAVAGGGTVACGGGTCTATQNGGAAEGLFIDPYTTSVPQKPAAWEYQSFGVWTTTAGSNGTFGAISFGALTPVGAMPTNLIATYTGLTAGVYVNPAGQEFGTAATLNASVNFGINTFSFNTSGTTMSAPAGFPPTDLNLSGTMTRSGNSFTGGLTTANTQLLGNATGRFYGPSAEEIGGVYNLTGAGLESMGGAFGGKRP